jgi:hypothetical protein
VTRPQQLADLVDVIGPLRHEDRVGAGGDPGVGRDPAGLTPHHLDHDHTVVRLGGRAQPVDRVGRDLHSGVEAERQLRAAEIVVDRLRHADDRHPRIRQASRDAERVVAADRDQRIDALRLERGANDRRPVGAVGERVGP